MISGYADTAEFEVFRESVKRRDLSIQSTDTALANALNGSYLDSNDIDISKPALRTIPGAIEGRKVSIKIQIPATRDAAQLIANIASDLGLIANSAICPCELCRSNLLASNASSPGEKVGNWR